MTLLFIILLPFLAGLLCYLFRPAAMHLALATAAGLMGLGISAAFASKGSALVFSLPWIPQLGASFSLLGDGLSTMLCALSGIVILAVMLMQMNKEVENASSFYGLLMFSIAGINGVFLAADGLLFYFFWELALIPVYFLCSRWGGARRIAVTFKFFVYTFAGSLMMLAGLIYLYLQTPTHSYAWHELAAVARSLPAGTQLWVFILVFVAFAIKIPVFPFHTWQPDTYEVSAPAVTIVLSALMVKMGMYGVIRWVLPFFPDAVAHYGNFIATLGVIGVVYASCLAIAQSDLKRLIAYSSIAHMGLMVTAAFSLQSPDTSHAAINSSYSGLIVQMFNHGINIAGLWLIAQMIEERYGTRDLRKLGGMASGAPWLSTTLVIVAFANISLPLTNGFIGEFMLFNGIFQSASQYHIAFMVFAGTAIILGAAYMLSMVRSVAYGNLSEGLITPDLSANEGWAMAIIITLIIFLGIYPQPLIQLAQPGFLGWNHMLSMAAGMV